MFAAFHDEKALALVSRSRDADLLCALLLPTRVSVVRGSSSHGSMATRHLLRHLQQGGKVIMALDGPKGPARIEKPGVDWLCKQSGAALCRMEFHVRHAIRLPDWSRLRLPHPFAGLHVRIHLSFPSMSGSAIHTTSEHP
ncbi:MAG: hypothetical protein RL318_982 [Fibrobacterota bacterium]